MKEKFEKCIIIKKIYRIWKRNYAILICKISPRIASKRFYKKVIGKKLNLDNPQGFNEKLMFLKLNNYNNNEDVFKCSDKYQIREYVISKGICQRNLPTILKTYKSVDEINFDELPNKFVLKCSHGCGFNIVCQDKRQLNYNDAIRKLKKWQKIKFGFETAEPHYTHVIPTIFCEEYIENVNGGFPNDYKIYCFNGKPKLVLICSERESNLRLNFFDLNWNELFIGTKEYRSEKKLNKPKCFQKMLEISEKISKDFPFVRCDFYENKGEAILGEMTFTPAGCVALYYTEEGEKYLGDLIELNKEMN